MCSSDLGNSVNKIGLKDSVDSLFILAILNSNIIDWLFRKTSTNNHVNIYELEQLPIPNSTEMESYRIVSLVKEIIELKKNNASADTSALESEIDRLVYQLYGLTEEEIRIVEGKE